MVLSFIPTLDTDEIGRRLDRLLVPGPLADPRLERRIERLARDFVSFAASYPLPLWAPGLVLDPEMRSLSEALFPMKEVRPVFQALLGQGCRFRPLLEASYLFSSPTWFDFLNRFRPLQKCADPAAILAELYQSGEARQRFLFALLLPHHFGGAFDRYPLQTSWLEAWLARHAGRFAGGIRALDSACGSGEGSYGLAESILKAGLTDAVVHGSTLEHFELFAAAHAWFPHDLERSREYRGRIAPLFAEGSPVRLEFYLDEVGELTRETRYQVILCNGLLGGPLLHEVEELERAVAALAARLEPGGVLLAADRFHAGWRLKVPAEKLRALMRAQGLVTVEVPEGVAGEKPEA
jgi:hypothetical protein